MIPLSRPQLGPEDEEAVLAVLRSGMLAMGPRTREFEEAWAEYCGVRHAVLMANGTVALEAILRGLGIGRGDEVVTVSFTFNATVSAILQTGARPVFVDVTLSDYCMDPAQVEAAITPRTKAILPVHLYGLMANMGAGDLRICDNDRWDPSTWPEECAGSGFHEAPRGALALRRNVRRGGIKTRSAPRR